MIVTISSGDLTGDEFLYNTGKVMEIMLQDHHWLPPIGSTIFIDKRDYINRNPQDLNNLKQLLWTIVDYMIIPENMEIRISLTC